MNTIKIFCVNTSSHHEVQVGLSLKEIYLLLGIQLPHLCTGAKVNNRTEGLNYLVYRPKDIEFIDISSEPGMRIYVRSLCFLLGMATNDVLPQSRLRIEYHISNGYFCQINNHQKISEDIICQIKSRMLEIISMNKTFNLEEAHTDDVIEIFKSMGQKDKVALLKTSNQTYSYYYHIDGYFDYHYGALLSSTADIYLFDLISYKAGMLLIPPCRYEPTIRQPQKGQSKLLKTLDEYKGYNYISGLSNVGNMNKLIMKGQQSPMILVSEALQEKKIAAIADEIARRGNIKMVLIAGPSSSGKTTFAKRLSIQLMTNMLRPLAISLDDYFLNRNDTPLDKDGNKDYESLYALDLDLFNSDLKKLLDGEEISLPTFNFEKGEREYRGNKLKLKPNNILILEGIHGLNPILTAQIHESCKYKIYVSTLTTINLDDHNWIPSTDNRLIRRIVRDNQFRGITASETIARWPSVRAGEDKWIFPYQELADTMFNSAMLYELSVLKEGAEAVLRQVPKASVEYSEAYRLLRFLSYFKPIVKSDIPRTSLLREFLGGSRFHN